MEEITSTYVVLGIWDERRLIIPLQWFIENPFQNWTRTSSDILGTVFLFAHYKLPLDPLRAELKRVLEAASEWDRPVGVLQLTDVTERTIQIRVLVSARSSGFAFDLRCRVREAWSPSSSANTRTACLRCGCHKAVQSNKGRLQTAHLWCRMDEGCFESARVGGKRCLVLQSCRQLG